MKSRKGQNVKLARLLGMSLAIIVLVGWLALLLTSSVAQASSHVNTPTPEPVPILELSKTRKMVNDLNNNGIPDPGETIEYIITINNVGAASAFDLKIADDYDQLYFAPLTTIGSDGNDDGDIISWNIEMLAAGEEISISYNTMLIAIFPVGTTKVENTVTLTVSNEGIEPLFGSDTFSVAVPSPTPPPPSPTAAPTETVSTGDVGTISGTSDDIVITSEQYVKLINYLLTLSTIGLVLLAILYYFPKEIGTGANKIKVGQSEFLVAYIFAVVMATIVVLGIGAVIPHSTIAGLIGTIAGYLLRGAQN